VFSITDKLPLVAITDLFEHSLIPSAPSQENEKSEIPKIIPQRDLSELGK
jgi:hypothetical protein